MAQIFHHSTNTFSRITIYGAVFVLGFLTWCFATLNGSGYATREGEVRDQPVPFSHAHHVADDGIDCRYCHTTVETSNIANIPPTKTCMNCHSQIWNTSPMLEPVRESFRSGRSIAWTRVHDLPDYVYFNHSIHVNKGVGCETCHGRVDPHAADVPGSTRCRWSGAWTATGIPSSMCGRARRCSPWDINPPEDQETLGRRLVAEYKIQDARTLTSCSTCHR